MVKTNELYRGKSKIIYETNESSLIIQYFTDDLTALNGVRKEIVLNKGILCNKVSSLIFRHLENNSIKTHYLEQLNEREMLVKKVDIIPIEVVMRNYIAGSLSKRLGLPDGKRLNNPIMEYYYKDDNLGDPLINDYHIKLLGLATENELTEIKMMSFMINCLLEMLFDRCSIKLVDFKLEYGRTKNGIVLADEISPDGCRLWDKNTNERLDKDRFRMNLGNIEESYQDVYNRLSELFKVTKEKI